MIKSRKEKGSDVDYEKNSVAEVKGGARPLFPLTGNLILANLNEWENNEFGLFVENVWEGVRGDDLATSFSPTGDALILWVSATTQEKVDEVLDWTLQTLKDGFGKKGSVLNERPIRRNRSSKIS